MPLMIKFKVNWLWNIDDTFKSLMLNWTRDENTLTAFIFILHVWWSVCFWCTFSTRGNAPKDASSSLTTWLRLVEDSIERQWHNLHAYLPYFIAWLFWKETYSVVQNHCQNVLCDAAIGSTFARQWQDWKSLIRLIQAFHCLLLCPSPTDSFHHSHLNTI